MKLSLLDHYVFNKLIKYLSRNPKLISNEEYEVGYGTNKNWVEFFAEIDEFPIFRVVKRSACLYNLYVPFGKVLSESINQDLPEIIDMMDRAIIKGTISIVPGLGEVSHFTYCLPITITNLITRKAFTNIYKQSVEEISEASSALDDFYTDLGNYNAVVSEFEEGDTNA